MKYKAISTESFEQIIKPNEEILFTEESHIPGINTPTNFIFMATHGVPPVVGVSSVCGTTYTFRIDQKDTKLFNIDAYSYRVGGSSVLQINKVDPSLLEWHWTDNLPEFMKKEIPKEIETKIENIKKEHGK